VRRSTPRSIHSTRSQGAVSDVVADHRLGVLGVVFSQLSQIAFVTVVFAVFPGFIAASGLIGVPIAVIAAELVLTVFAGGYLAMSRHIPNPGAFYAYIARVWRPLGVGAGWLAIVSYVCFNQSAAGGFGYTAAKLVAGWTGIDLPWWLFAGAVAGAVAVLGVKRVDLSAKVLAGLAGAETLVVLLNDVAVMVTPGFRFSAAPMNPALLWSSGVGPMIVAAGIAFVGFEAATAYIGESRDPKRTVLRATYITLGVAGFVYWFSMWVQISAAPDVVSLAGDKSSDLFGYLSTPRLGGWAVDLNRTLFCTSVAGALLAFHNVPARYIAVLGREGILPRFLGRVKDEAPRNASLTLSAITAIVIIAYAVTGTDPQVKLFYWGAAAGGLGVLLLVTATCFAIIVFFLQNSRGENLWHRFVAPLLAGIVLVAISYQALTHLPDLYGPGSETISELTPWIAAGIVAAGIIWGVIVEFTRPDVYARIGQGGHEIGGGIASLVTGPDEVAGARS
jgi:amino acid transporter